MVWMERVIPCASRISDTLCLHTCIPSKCWWRGMRYHFMRRFCSFWHRYLFPFPYMIDSIFYTFGAINRRKSFCPHIDCGVLFLMMILLFDLMIFGLFWDNFRFVSDFNGSSEQSGSFFTNVRILIIWIFIVAAEFIFTLLLYFCLCSLVLLSSSHHIHWGFVCCCCCSLWLVLPLSASINKLRFFLLSLFLWVVVGFGVNGLDKNHGDEWNAVRKYFSSQKDFDHMIQTQAHFSLLF